MFTRKAPEKTSPPATPEGSAVATGATESLRHASIRRRMTFTLVCLGIGLLATTLELSHLQLANHDELRQEASRNYVRQVPLDDWRGDMVDRDGALLAVTVHRWSISADPTRFNAEDVRRASTVLAELTGRDAGQLAEKLQQNRPGKLAVRNDDPTARAAREAVRPVAEAVAKVFDFPVERFDRKMALLEYFYRADQLRSRGVYQLVDTLDRIAEAVGQVMTAGAHELRFFDRRGRKFVYIARDVDDDTARRVDEARDRYRAICRQARDEGRPCRNPLAAVSLKPEPRRYYPKRNLATQLVGLVGSDSRALDGMELAMDGVLAGKQHQTQVVRDRRGRMMFLEGIPDDVLLSAPSVELTIDQDIQLLAEGALTKACRASGARAGYAMVMHVPTGEVLGAASYPTFNPNTYREFFRDRRPLSDQQRALGQKRSDLEWASTWPGLKRALPGQTKRATRESWRSLARETNAFMEFQHAYPNAARHAGFQSGYEPGSIMKVFTLAAWVEEAIYPLNHQYSLFGGEWELGDADENVIGDDHHYEMSSTDPIYGLKTSSNIVYGQMGRDLGSRTLDRYLRSFGFGTSTGSGFPGESAGSLRQGAEWKLVETVNIAFGQGVATTGIQLVSALATLANGGVRMRPLLVRRILDEDGRELKRWEPTAVERVVSERTARTTLDVMATVIEPGGTGTRAYIPEYPVAGKTGTGQKPHLRKKGYAENMWVATFFGVAPTQDPELAVLVLVDEPKGKRYGGVVAAPAFREIMRGALRHMGVSSPFDAGTQVAGLEPDLLATRRALPPKKDAQLASVAPPVDPLAAGDVPVPDLRGMTMDQVRQLTADIGLRTRLIGSGTARVQDRAPHTRIASGSVITVVFEPRAPGAVLAQRTLGAAPGVQPTPLPSHWGDVP